MIQPAARKMSSASTSAEAVAVAQEKAQVGAPVVIADAADNPGGGGYGDEWHKAGTKLKKQNPEPARDKVDNPHEMEAALPLEREAMAEIKAALGKL